jgi:hypothetical protein
LGAVTALVAGVEVTALPAGVVAVAPAARALARPQVSNFWGFTRSVQVKDLVGVAAEAPSVEYVLFPHMRVIGRGGAEL